MRTAPLNYLDRKYIAWRDENPDYYPLFVKLATELVAAGRPFGVHFLIQRVRWEVNIEWKRTEQFKISNNYSAYLARDLIEDVPGLKALIRLHRVHGDFGGTSGKRAA